VLIFCSSLCELVPSCGLNLCMIFKLVQRFETSSLYQSCMDYSGALNRFVFCQLVLATITELDPFVGLPCFIFYSRVFQLILRVWSGCYREAIRAYRLDENECTFLFRWFLLGGVLDNDEFQDALSIAIRFCKHLQIPETGWAALSEYFKFATQHGRIEQPWGLRCVRWIQAHRL
jgi:hypothetical protein